MIHMWHRWITDTFKKADENNNGLLSLKEVEKLLESLNFGLSSEEIERRFQVRLL